MAVPNNAVRIELFCKFKRCVYSVRAVSVYGVSDKSVCHKSVRVGFFKVTIHSIHNHIASDNFATVGEVNQITQSVLPIRQGMNPKKSYALFALGNGGKLGFQIIAVFQCVVRAEHNMRCKNRQHLRSHFVRQRTICTKCQYIIKIL